MMQATSPEICLITPHEFPLYDAIPERFEVTSYLCVEVLGDGLGGFRMHQEPVDPAYVQDYNAAGDDCPTAWAHDFDIVRWGIFLAREGDQVLGGATIAVGEGRPFPMGFCQGEDLAVLWDIRVDPAARRRGTGTTLFRYAADWARAQGYTRLAIETQNVNVPACRFYLRQGCSLGAIHRFGYLGNPDVAHEVMLLWYLDL